MTNYTPGQFCVDDMKAAPWLLQITQLDGVISLSMLENVNGTLKTQATTTYPQIRHCLRAIRLMVSMEIDASGRSREIQRLIDDRVSYRGDIPLCEETGAKLALLFILCPDDALRAELLAWRINRFTREEAYYWLCRVTIPCCYAKNTKSLSWAREGLRTMLCGDGKEDEQLVCEMLDALRK